MPEMLVTSAALTDAEVKSLAPGYATVIRSLAGRLRYAYELAFGVSAAPNEQPGTPRNPQGLFGVDLSGPPWGPAYRHPLAVLGGMKPDTSGAGEWCGQKADHLLVTDGVTRFLPIRIPVRAHEAHEGAPYSRGYPIITVYQTGAASAKDVTVICRTTPGHGLDSDREETFTMASSTNEQSFEVTAAFWNLVPGMNSVQLGLRTDYNANLSLVRLSVNCVEKHGF